MSDSSDDASSSPRRPRQSATKDVPVMDYEKRIDSPRIPRKRNAPESEDKGDRPREDSTAAPSAPDPAPPHTRRNQQPESWNGNGAGPEERSWPHGQPAPALSAPGHSAPGHAPPGHPATGQGAPGHTATGHVPATAPGYNPIPGAVAPPSAPWDTGNGRMQHQPYPNQTHFQRSGPWNPHQQQPPPPPPHHQHQHQQQYPQRPWPDQRQWQQPANAPPQVHSWQVDRRGGYNDHASYGWAQRAQMQGYNAALPPEAYHGGGPGHMRGGHHGPDYPGHAYRGAFSEQRGQEQMRASPPMSAAKRPRNSGTDTEPAGLGLAGPRPNSKAEKISFKEFLEYLPDDVTAEEAQSRYEEYCNKETGMQPNNTFFAKHKDSAWFREKYHPDTVLQRTARIREETKQRSVEFKLLLDQPTGLDKIVDSSLAKPEDERRGLESAAPQQNTLFIRSCPGTVSRDKIIDAFKTGPKGEELEFVRLRVGEPSPTRAYSRCVWASYASPTAAATALEIIRGREIPIADSEVFRLEPTLNQEKSRKLGAPSLHVCFSEPTRMQHDLAQAESIARHLDKIRQLEKEDNPLTDDVLAGCSVEKRLDAWTAYLRNVHMYIYFNGGNFSDDPPLISDVPRRMALNSDVPSMGNGELSERKVDEKSATVLAWKVDRTRNGAQDAEAMKEEALQAWLDKNTIQEKDDRFRCALPPHKLFRGPEFVHKHLKTKHADVMAKLVQEAVDKCYHENYARDPNHLDASSEIESSTDRAAHRPGPRRPGFRSDGPPRGRQGRHSGPKNPRRSGGRDLDLSPSRDGGRPALAAEKADHQKARLVQYADV